MKEQQSSKLETMIIIILLVFGIGTLLYPTISQQWNHYRESKLVQNTTKIYQEISDETKQRDLEKAKEYNDSLIGGIVPNVFAVREGQKDDEYESTLNPSGSGVMGSITIPKIHADIPIYHYTSEDVLEKGCGHIFGSSFPIGGENTHAVLSAHRGVPQAKLFTDLDLIQEEDHFYIKILGTTLAYQVDHIETVEPDNTRSLAIEQGKDYVTLVTCTPYGINTKRLLVRGHRIPYSEDNLQEEKKKVPKKWTRLLSRVSCVVIGLLLAGLLKAIGNLWSKKYAKKEENESVD